MCKRFASLLFLICATSAIAQAPTQVLRAAHCLAKKQFLDTSKSVTFHVGYSLDSVSYPGKLVIYLTIYPYRDRSKGFVFTVFRDPADGSTFDVQNNASFVGSPDNIDFPGPPLGGTWTQQQLIAAIKHTYTGHLFSLSVKNLLAPLPDTHCESYTDPQPTPAMKQ